MAGIEIDLVTEGLSEFIAELQAATGELRERLEDVMAEKAIEYNQDLRGSGPGAGITPFRTGRLLSSGEFEESDVLGIAWENPTNYASYARKSGDPVGKYARDTEDAFVQRFAVELVDEWDDLVRETLEV